LIDRLTRYPSVFQLRLFLFRLLRIQPLQPDGAVRRRQKLVDTLTEQQCTVHKILSVF